MNAVPDAQYDGGKGGAKVLVVDDEPQIRRLLQVTLEANGYEAMQAEDGKTALAMGALNHPDIIILDLGLPDMDGQELIRRFREWTTTPILVLSVRDQEADKVQALDAGADDFITKPFSMPELMARLRVALRHSSGTESAPVIRLGKGLVIDRTAHRVTLCGREVRLTPTEYSLLVALAEYPGRVMTHRHLLKSVWGPGYESEMRYLRVYVAQLRQKIEEVPGSPRFILTEPGIGYRACDPEDVD